MGRRSDARTRLVSSADLLFRERGFSSVSISELCAAANVNKGSFYHFFQSKLALLLEVIDTSWDETGMLRSWEEKAPTQPINELRHFFQELFAFHYADRESNGFVRGPLLVRLALEPAAREPTVAKKLDSLLTREIGAIESVLVAAVDRGEISLSNTHQTAVSLIACIHGLLMLATAQNNLFVLPQAENELLRLVGKI